MSDMEFAASGAGDPGLALLIHVSRKQANELLGIKCCEGPERALQNDGIALVGIKCQAKPTEVSLEGQARRILDKTKRSISRCGMIG